MTTGAGVNASDMRQGGEGVTHSPTDPPAPAPDPSPRGLPPRRRTTAPGEPGGPEDQLQTNGGNMTEFRVKLLPEQRYQTRRNVAVYAGGDYRGALAMQPAEAVAFAAAFEELALSREILTEDVLDAAAAVLGERNGVSVLLALYETARDRATA